MKRLICCLDGTWDDDKDGTDRTNVAKLHHAIQPVDGKGVRQISHYVAGIATTEGQKARFLKGAVGLEVGDRIERGYRFLIDNYDAGDELFLFGFSRGAFEARSLASFISVFGLARKAEAFPFEEAWRLYRQPERHRDIDTLARLSAACHYPVRIRCVGVWDTVGNIGNPLSPRGLLSRRLNFHDMRLHDTIDVALQALSIDERRGPFSPTLWTIGKGTPLPPHQRVEQVWFAGSHADIGGGEHETDLSDIALLWMAERAGEAAGLACDTARLVKAARPNPLGVAHDSATGTLFKWSNVVPYVRLVRQEKRGVPMLRRMLLGSWRTGRIAPDQVSLNETIDASAMARIGQQVPVLRRGSARDTIYRPLNLTAALEASPTTVS